MSERPRSGPPHYNGGQYKHHTKHLPKIRLESAMRDFQAMFPGLTPMVIEAVLRANGGAVDPTVEKLISLCYEQQQQQQEKKKELLDESDMLPGYYEACCKEQPPPSYHVTQTYQDASTQTEQHSESCIRICQDEDEPVLEDDRLSSDNVEHLCVATLSSTNSSSNSLSSDNSSSVKEDDEKVALYLQNKELLQQLRQKQRIIEYLERTNSCREQNNGIKPNRYSDPVMSLVPQVEGSTGTVHHPIPRSTRNRRAQTLSIQRQQNSSPPPNATVDTKETLDIPDHSMLPGLSRNQPCRKSAKKRLQNWSKKLLKRNAGNDVYP